MYVWSIMPFKSLTNNLYYMEGNFGGGKRWQIWRMTMDSPNLSQPNFIQLKKVSRDRIHLRYYFKVLQP